MGRGGSGFPVGEGCLRKNAGLTPRRRAHTPLLNPSRVHHTVSHFEFKECANRLYARKAFSKRTDPGRTTFTQHLLHPTHPHIFLKLDHDDFLGDVLLRDGDVFTEDFAEALAGHGLRLEKLLNDDVDGLAVVANLLSATTYASSAMRFVATSMSLASFSDMALRAIMRMIMSPPCEEGSFSAQGANVGHAEGGDHLLRHARHLLQVARCAGGDLGVTENHLLCRAPAKCAHNAREDLLLAR